MRDNGGVTTPREQSPDETSEVLIRRSPRYLRFMGAGAILGIVVALILTFAFPDSRDFTQAQVFGFLALFAIVIFGTVGALVALAFDRVASRRARIAVAGRVEARGDRPAGDAGPEGSGGIAGDQDRPA